MDELLPNIQGNILKPFRRKHAEYLFLEFAAGTPAMRRALGGVLSRYVTSASDQDEISKMWKDKKPTPPVGNFALSFSGYVKLGLESAAPSNTDYGAKPFRDGIRDFPYVWKANVDEWMSPYKDKVIDGYILLAHDDRPTLDKKVAELKTDLSGLATITGEETGLGIRDTDDKDFEHFGFRETLRPLLEPAAVFTPEPLAGPGESFGCYTAFLKIEQNVPEFKKQCRDLADKANAAGATPPVSNVAVEEFTLGRRHNGDSLVDAHRNDPDSFTFHGVPASVCPFHAHTRVMNQRDSAALPSIVRRGVTYGIARPDLESGAPGVSPPATGSGLLFLSFQRSLFDFLTLMGKAQRNFDPVLVRDADWMPAIAPADRAQDWELGGQRIRHRMADLTKVLGGAYFYTPSMTFIRML